MLPLWSRDVRELFYREGTLFKTVTVSTSEELNPGEPTTLFDARFDPAP